MVYIGHLITPDGIKPDPEKFETITKYPLSNNSDEIRRFVVFCLNSLLKRSKIHLKH